MTCSICLVESLLTPVVDGDVDLGLDQGPGLVRPHDLALCELAADLEAGVADLLAAARRPLLRSADSVGGRSRNLCTLVMATAEAGCSSASMWFWPVTKNSDTVRCQPTY
jgi:hypothetical protein